MTPTLPNMVRLLLDKAAHSMSDAELQNLTHCTDEVAWMAESAGAAAQGLACMIETDAARAGGRSGYFEDHEALVALLRCQAMMFDHIAAMTNIGEKAQNTIEVRAILARAPEPHAMPPAPGAMVKARTAKVGNSKTATRKGAL
jgi:hypothetical protein